MAEKVSKISLIMTSAPYYILPHDHFTINFLLWDSFIGQLISIVSKVRKVRKKDINIQCMQYYYRNPSRSDINFYITFSASFLYRRKYSVDYNSPTYFCTDIFYFYEHE